MTFKFIPKATLGESAPLARFAPPGVNDVFKYWLLAAGPAYVLTVVRVTTVVDAANLECVFFDPYTGQEIADPPVKVNLDAPSVWRSFPSTIGDPTTPPIGATNNCAVLCLTEPWIAANAPKLAAVFTAHPELKRKYPVGDDGFDTLTKAVKDLATALKAAGGDPTTLASYNNAVAHLPIPVLI